jgi:hypothetical protein
MGPFGSESSRDLSLKAKVPHHVNSVSIFSEYPELTGRNYIEESDKVQFMNNWEDVLKRYQDSARKEIQVAVFPGADIQYSSYH